MNDEGLTSGSDEELMPEMPVSFSPNDGNLTFKLCYQTIIF